MKAKSWDEIVAMVAQAVKNAKPGQWIYGRGWHQEKWTSSRRPNVEGFPTHDVARAASRRTIPVLLTHASGHASFANAKAMQLSDVDGIDAESRRRRRSSRTQQGNPTGLFRETASRLIRRGSRRAAPTPAEAAARARRVLELALAGGRLEGHHVVPGRRLELRRRRSDEEDGRRREDRRTACG